MQLVSSNVAFLAQKSKAKRRKDIVPRFH